jgi:hypothetical protein
MKVNVQITQESAALLRTFADESGLDLSTFVRDAVRVYHTIRQEVVNKDKKLYIGVAGHVEKEIHLP